MIQLENSSLLLPPQPTVLSSWCTASKHYLNSWETNWQIFRSALRSLLCCSPGAAYSRSPGSHISLCFSSPEFQTACSQCSKIGPGTTTILGTSLLDSTYGQLILIFLTPGILTVKLHLHSTALYGGSVWWRDCSHFHTYGQHSQKAWHLSFTNSFSQIHVLLARVPETACMWCLWGCIWD